MARGLALLTCGVGLALFAPAFTPSLPRSGLSAMPKAGPRRESLTQRAADGSGLKPFGPVVAYAKALMDAAIEKKEIVLVTDDVLKIKDQFLEEEWLEKLLLIQSNPKFSALQKATETVKILPKLKSTVMPKFIVFLAKKNRLRGLKRICLEYVQSMYFNQSITPVTVKVAQRLTEQQMEKIKEKMKKKAGTRDIKLVVEVDPSLIGGLQLEWGYTDPQNRYAPSYGVDLSLKNILEKRALQKGVVTAA
ncbi:unnamed protein product [Durusdinium trenchii]|uniref:Uncharacterized protein n=1 Tax=Durusdinium trenchii TaxID=1381693 RepID=A0ABP0PU31_9DINO